MVTKSSADYIIYNGKRVQKKPVTKSKSNQPLPMTRDAWLDETADTVGMYKQLTLFPMEKTAPTAAVKTEEVESQQVPHQKSLRFLAKDTQNQINAPDRPRYPGVVTGPETHPADAVSATDGELYLPGKTEIKKDQFPGRVHYVKGGLYPPGKLNDPKTVELHANAPNYRKMPGMPVHGVGQPTAKGFEDVLKHLDGKSKPVVWANTRAEAVIYINGELYGLFTVLDTIDDIFLARWFVDPTGSMFEHHDGDFTDDYVQDNIYFQHEEGKDDRTGLQAVADAL